MGQRRGILLHQSLDLTGCKRATLLQKSFASEQKKCFQKADVAGPHNLTNASAFEHGLWHGIVSDNQKLRLSVTKMAKTKQKTLEKV